MFPLDDKNKSNDKLVNVKTIDTSDERKALDSLDNKEENKKPEEINLFDEKEEKKKPVKKDKEEKKENEDENEELNQEENNEENEDEQDEDDENEEDENDDEVKSDSLYQQLKEYDSKIFKENPELKEVIFRERAYTERFPTVKDADEAIEALNTLNGYNNDILNGKSDVILEALEQTDKGALKDFVANFIPSVEKLNKDLYYEMIGPEIKKLLRIYAKHTDERVSVSAQNLHYAVFGDSNLDKDVGLSRKETKKSERDENISKREKELEDRIVSTFAGEVKTSCENRIKRSISSAFNNSGLSSLMTNKLVDEIFTRVGNELQSDTRHMGGMNSLWRQAKTAGFTSEWKDRIVNAYLSRAKALVPKYRQKVLTEAKVNVKTGDDLKEKKRIVPSNQTQNRSFSGGKLDPKKVDWNKTDERAMLDGNVVLKKN